MEDIRILFFDIDGTLVNPKTGSISEKTAEAIHRLRIRGKKVCIATGRPTASLPDLRGFSIDAFCTFNGSLCYTESEIIHSDPIAPRDVDTILKNAAAIGRPVSLAIRNRLVANGFDQDLADYYALAGLTLTADPDFEEACREDVYQIMLGCRKSDHDTIVQDAQGVKVAVSWDRAVDIIPVGSGKGSAIAKILTYFGLNPSQAMAFGDSYNDVEMLQAVGTGVAMGNAPDELKAVADAVCRPVSEDGIFHYCLEHDLI